MVLEQTKFLYINMHYNKRTNQYHQLQAHYEQQLLQEGASSTKTAPTKGGGIIIAAVGIIARRFFSRFTLTHLALVRQLLKS